MIWGGRFTSGLSSTGGGLSEFLSRAFADAGPSLQGFRVSYSSALRPFRDTLDETDPRGSTSHDDVTLLDDISDRRAPSGLLCLMLEWVGGEGRVASERPSLFFFYHK